MYKVEMEFTYGWDDADWHDGDEPWRFATKGEAQAEIDDLCAHTDHTPDEYRVVKA